MKSDYLDKKAASDRLYAQVVESKIEETTPSEITPLVCRLAAQLKEGATPAFIPVKDDPYGLFGYCSDGVLEKVARDGGGIAFGWCIWEWPKILFTAEFHAVWKAPSGELLDITPKPNGETRILFVHDDTYPHDFDFDCRPLNRRMCALEASDPKAFAAVRLGAMTPGQLRYERSRAEKANQTIEQWLASRAPRDPQVGLIEEFIEACDEVDRLMDEAPKLSEGYARGGPALVTAMRRKMHLMDAVRRGRSK